MIRSFTLIYFSDNCFTPWPYSILQFVNSLQLKILLYRSGKKIAHIRLSEMSRCRKTVRSQQMRIVWPQYWLYDFIHAMSLESNRFLTHCLFIGQKPCNFLKIRTMTMPCIILRLKNVLAKIRANFDNVYRIKIVLQKPDSSFPFTKYQNIFDKKSSQP